MLLKIKYDNNMLTQYDMKNVFSGIDKGACKGHAKNYNYFNIYINIKRLDIISISYQKMAPTNRKEKKKVTRHFTMIYH